MKPDRLASVRAALVEGSRGGAANEDAEAVTISIVPDVAKFLDERSLTLHGDVVEALVDLVVALLDEEGANDESSDR